MAHHKSAKKRIRTNAHKNEINRTYLSAVRTSVKKFSKYVTSGSMVENKTAQELFITAQSLLAKAASKGMMHKNTASRKIGRLTKLLAKSVS